jgi:hypothetical protein
VRSVTGSHRHLPRRVSQPAAEHAIALGREVMGDDLLLLALLELDPDQPARRALEAEGVTRERVLDRIRAMGDESAEKPRGVTYSPATYTIQGRAEGFAAVLGDGPIMPEHVLLALLWDPVSMSSHSLWKLGVARERVLDRLREAGVRVPSAPLPPQREVDWGERVWFDRDKVTVVLDQVRLHLSPETSWGFNYEDDRAWVRAESSVDLQALVDRALAAK